MYLLTGTVPTVSSTSRPQRSWTCGLCHQCWWSILNASHTVATWGINWTHLLTSRSGRHTHTHTHTHSQGTAFLAVYPVYVLLILFKIYSVCMCTLTIYPWWVNDKLLCCCVIDDWGCCIIFFLCTVMFCSQLKVFFFLREEKTQQQMIVSQKGRTNMACAQGHQCWHKLCVFLL